MSLLEEQDFHRSNTKEQMDTGTLECGGWVGGD